MALGGTPALPVLQPIGSGVCRLRNKFGRAAPAHARELLPQVLRARQMRIHVRKYYRVALFLLDPIAQPRISRIVMREKSVQSGAVFREGTRFMFKRQRTLRAEIQIEGIGLHTGYAVRLQLLPAPENTGLVFRRTDLRNFRIEATRAHVARVSYATTLMKKGVMISTVEHLLSALYGLGIDNAYIDVDSMEVPILDGSGLRFVELIEQAGAEEQEALREYIIIEKPIEVRQGDKVAGVYPDSMQRATYEIEFEHAAIGRQEIELTLTPESYRREVAPARTFGFIADVEYLKKSGLIRGGSLENAVVLDESGIVNAELRFPDEFVRHKLLDLIGDISLVGHPIIGHLYARRAGHAIHTALADQIARLTSHYRIGNLQELRERAVNL
jgi:UDP-3-O-[3-hydroxymyristoyl] N-acetylglucosamine deacetylase